MEMGSLGSATAETRSKSLVVVRILHFRIVGCFSPTAQKSHRGVKRSETSIPLEPVPALTHWGAVLEDVIDRETLLPQRPALHNAAVLIGCTQKDLGHTGEGSLALREPSHRSADLPVQLSQPVLGPALHFTFHLSTSAPTASAVGTATCSEFSLVRNLRWVTAGYLSLLRGSVVQRRNRDGNSSVSMRHFSFTTLTTTWTHREWTH